MIVYFSTVFRTAPMEKGGELVQLNWDRKVVLNKVPIVPENPKITDPNPRGGTRGGRGILLTPENVFIASYHTIYVFDLNLSPVRSFSNNLFADLHEMAWDGKAIWATSTVLDGAIKIDPTGKTVDSWWPREDPVTVKRFKLPPLALDKDKDNRLSYLGTSFKQPGHTHLNTVAMLEGRPLVLLNKFGCVVRLNPTEILIEDPRLQGAHNILVTSDRQIIINDTSNQGIMAYHPDGSFHKRINWPPFGRFEKYAGGLHFGV